MEEETIEEESTDLGFNPEELVAAAVAGRFAGLKDDDDDNDLSAALKPKAPRDMPKIDHLSDAIVVADDGTLDVKVLVGSRILIERRSSVLNGGPWLETKMYDVREIDPEIGLLKLWDQELHHHARENYKIGLDVGSKYKLPPVKGRWDAAPKLVPVKPQQPVVLNAEGDPVKKGRGRPKGSKNRSKDEIKAERDQLRQMRSAKRSKNKVK
jgi:hypothetical protein